MNNNKNNNKEITEKDVRYVASLSRMSMTDKEVANFKNQLGDILKYIEQLNEVDVEGVEPTSHVLSSMKNVFREDVLKESLSKDEALSNAPAKEKNFF